MGFCLKFNLEKMSGLIYKKGSISMATLQLDESVTVKLTTAILEKGSA